MPTEKLQFVKMWEVFGLTVFDADADCVEPVVQLKKIASFSDAHCLFYSKDGKGTFYYEAGEMKKAAIAGKKDFLSKSFQKKYFGRINMLVKEINKFIDERHGMILGQLSDKELKQEIEIQLKRVVEIYTYYIACQPQVISLIEQDARLLLEKIVGLTEVDDVFSLLCTPQDLSTIQKEELEWLRLVAKIKTTKMGRAAINIAIAKHAHKYGIVFRSDGAQSWAVSDFENKLNQQKKAPVLKLRSRLTELENYTKTIRTKKLSAAKEYKFPKQLIELCNLLAKIGHERLEMRVRGWNPVTKFMGQYFGELEKRLDYGFRQLECLTIDELVRLFGGWRPTPKELEARKREYLVCLVNRKKHFYYGQQATLKLNELVTPNLQDLKVKEFNGSVAMKGHVTGKVVVFSWGDNIQEKLAMMDNTSILVAGQTRPQLMPLIHKCAAIITDEGGIISHAAIVARELKKPCVIGTKIATKVLKDGDYVEVDANKGIVKLFYPNLKKQTAKKTRMEQG